MKNIPPNTLYVPSYQLKLTNDSPTHSSISFVNKMVFKVAVNFTGNLLLSHVELVPGGEEGHLGRVLVKHHRVQVSTLVVLDQVICCVSRLSSSKPKRKHTVMKLRTSNTLNLKLQMTSGVSLMLQKLW